MAWILLYQRLRARHADSRGTPNLRPGRTGQKGKKDMRSKCGSLIAAAVLVLAAHGLYAQDPNPNPNPNPNPPDATAQQPPSQAPDAGPAQSAPADPSATNPPAGNPVNPDSGTVPAPSAAVPAPTSPDASAVPAQEPPTSQTSQESALFQADCVVRCV